MSQVLDGNLHRLEAPFFELREKPRAFVDEGASEEEGINTKTHNRSLVHQRWDECPFTFDELSDDRVGQPQTFRDIHPRALVEQHHANTEHIAGASCVHVGIHMHGWLYD